MANQSMLPIIGVVAAGGLAFGAGVYFMSQKSPPPAEPPVAGAKPAPDPEAKPAPETKAPERPNPEVKKDRAPKSDPTKPRLDPTIYDPKTNLPIPQKTVRGRWEKMSGYGLPNPRKLTTQEKAALRLLGTSNEVHSFKFSRTTLDDGSTIPGVPDLSSEQVRERVLRPIREKGLADGFEEAIRSLAVHNPNHINVLVTQHADWADVQKALGIKAELNPDAGSDFSYRSPDGKAVRYKIQWISSGWLSFGVDSGKVRAIRAAFGGFLVSYPEYIAAEDVPGGRSDPDPAKALKTPKRRPANAPPRPVETMQKLGKAAQITVVPYPVKKEPAIVKKLVAELTGKPIYPDIVEAARELKGKREVLELIITPSEAMTLDKMTDIMPDTRMRREDPRTFPGLKVTWYNYHWIEFGIVDGQVKKVRMHCQSMPKSIDK